MILHTPLSGGRRAVYEYDTLTLLQAKMAEAVFSHIAEAEKKPPRTFSEAQNAGIADYEIRAAAWLLRFTDEATGQPVEWTEATYEQMLGALRTAPVAAAATVEETLKDFFQRRGRGTLHWIVQSKHAINAAARFASAMTEAAGQSPMMSGESLLNEIDAFANSTTPNNDSAESAT